MGRQWFRSILVVAFANTVSVAQSVDIDQMVLTRRDPPRILAAVEVMSTVGAKPAALQWTFEYTREVERVIVERGESTTLAGKNIRCNSLIAETTCVAWGLNRNIIKNGVVAKATFFLTGAHSDSPIYIKRASAASEFGENLKVRTPAIPRALASRAISTNYLRPLRHDRPVSIVVLLAGLGVFGWSLYQNRKKKSRLIEGPNK